MRHPLLEYLNEPESFKEIVFIILFYTFLLGGATLYFFFLAPLLSILMIFMTSLFFVYLFSKNHPVIPFLILYPLELYYAFKNPILLKLKKSNPYKLRDIYFKSSITLKNNFEILKHLEKLPHVSHVFIESIEEDIDLDFSKIENFRYLKIHIKNKHKIIKVSHVCPHMTIIFKHIPEKFHMESPVGIHFKHLDHSIFKINAGHDLVKYLKQNIDNKYEITESSTLLEL